VQGYLFMENTYYLCPICQLALLQKDKQLICEANHSFDVAKEGYVNLLPVQFKKSKAPGDNKEMVVARRNFLEKGHYSPLADKLTSLVNQFSPNANFLLDAGCGEGYYTEQHATQERHVYGVDIAKEAIKRAAKRYKECHFSVGTLSNLPFSESSFDWLYSIYAPIIEKEFIRLLKPKGYLLTVTPARNHLFELKSIIYREAKAHDDEKLPITQMDLVHQEQLTYQLELNNIEDRFNLLAMTPFAFKRSENLTQTLEKMDSFSCTADFLIRIYQK